LRPHAAAAERAVGSGTVNIAVLTCGYVDNAKQRCPHTHRRSISRSAQIPYLFKAGTARPQLAAKAVAAPRGPLAPQAAKPRRMTRFHRGVPCQAWRSTEQERSGQITSYKNRTR
jgi:hypothetical protein